MTNYSRLNLCLPDDIENRLSKLSQESGISKSALGCEALIKYLDDQERIVIPVCEALTNDMNERKCEELSILRSQLRIQKIENKWKKITS